MSMTPCPAGLRARSPWRCRLVLLLVPWLLAAGPAAAQESPPAPEVAGVATGEVTGRIEGRAEAGLTVVLLRFGPQGATGGGPVARTTTDARGRYTFSDVAIDREAVYQVGARVEGRLVASERFRFPEGATRVERNVLPAPGEREAAAAHAPAERPEDLPRGRVTGTIMGHAEAGIPVMLLQLRLNEEGQPRPTPLGRSETDAEGGYTFTDVPIEPQTVYQLGARVEGRLVGSRPFSFPEGGRTVRHDLKVPEVRSDTGALRVDEALLVAEPRAGGARITEVVHLGNPTPDVIALGGSPLELPVAGGASDFEVLRNDLEQGSHDYLGPKLLLHGRVPPGRSVVAYRYRMDAPLGTLRWERRYPRGANLLRVLAPQGTLQAGGPELEALPPETFDEVTYDAWERPQVPAGATVRLRLTGAPMAYWVLWMPAAGFFVLMAGVVAWFLRRRLGGTGDAAA